MKWLLLSLGLLLLGAPASSAAEPFVKATIEGDGRIVPGQQVSVTVAVFVPNFFTSAPQFPLFDLPDAIVTLPDQRAQNMVSTIDGTQYAGIQKTYSVVPEVAGRFVLPPATIELSYSDGNGPVKGKPALPPATFTVGDHPGGSAGTLAFAARDLKIVQSFDRDPATLKVGDALVRTITVFAANTQAMMIPAMPAARTDGIKAYAKAPKLADGVEADDGSTGSTRTETITYVAEAAGTFEIPEIAYPWFDVDAHQQETALIPATQVTVSEAVLPPAGIAPQIQQTEDPGRSFHLTAKTLLFASTAFASAAVLCWLISRMLPAIQVRLRAYRNHRQTSERHKFTQLLAAIPRDDPRDVYRSLGEWTRSAGFATIGNWVAATDDPDIARETEALERRLFGAATDANSFDRAALLASIKKRRRLPVDRQQTRRYSLPRLNPGNP